MYKLKSIDQAMMTRTIELENEETGTIDICFDYSISFGFMKLGMSYDCKIELFGESMGKIRIDPVECTVINEDINIGKVRFIEVKVDEDKYYIFKKHYEDTVKKGDTITFDLSRKDLIQVNEVVHEDLIR